MNGHLEAKRRPAAPARRKSRRLLAQMLQLPPKQFFGHLGGPLSVGVGQAVATRWSCSANGRERPRMQLERVAQVVESDAMSQLRVQQTDGVAPGTESTRHIPRASFPRYLGNLV